MALYAGNMNNQFSHAVWLVPTSSILSIVIFAVTYFAYFDITHSNKTGSYIPLIIGGLVYLIIMSLIMYYASNKQGVLLRLSSSIITSLLATFIALFIFMFLVLNTLGS